MSKYNFNLEEIKEYIEEEKSIKEISEIYNCSLPTISRYLRKNNLHTKGYSHEQSKLFVDLTGMQFGRLKVLKLLDKKDKWGSHYYLCECQCENKTQKEVLGKRLLSGNTTSCNCYNKEKSTKHGMYKTRIYNILKGMNDRCYNKNKFEYKYYGEKNIEICEEWLDKEKGFMNFYNWAIKNGYDDNLTIDRIDGDKNYSPDNCRWITQDEQMRNTSRNIFLSYNGKTKTISEWSRELNIPETTIGERIKKFENKGIELGENVVHKIFSKNKYNRWDTII